MPTFDVTSEANWPEIENAVNQTTKELVNRFDFKGIESEILVDKKAKTITLKCGEEGKLDALRDLLETRLVKRNVSLFSIKPQKPINSTGRSVRQILDVQSGISKEKAKEVIELIKESGLKVTAKIQEEAIRVQGAKKDDLQAAIAMLKEAEAKVKMSMQCGNFRD